MTDSAFARAAAQTAAPATSNASSNPLPFNRENLFGTPSENKGGGAFVPTPPLDALIGRTLVYIPRTFDPAAKDPNNEGETRPQWTVDLYVLDGGELRFTYKRKGNPNATPPTRDEYVEHVHENCSPETPYEVPGMWVPQKALIPKLTAVSEKRQLLVGTIARGAQKKDIAAGATDATVRADHQAWIDRGKTGPEPRFVWLVEDVDAEGMNRVMSWYEIHKDSIKL